MIDPFDRPPPGVMQFEKHETVILCEGLDECFVVRQLCGHWHRAPKIGLLPPGTSELSELRLLVDLEVRRGRIAALGLVFDAEGNVAKRQKQIRGWLMQVGFDPPKQALRTKKTTIEGFDVACSYIINPHGQKHGAIEDYFLPQVVPTPQWLCIENLLACYDESAPTGVMREKIILRTFIAHRNGHNTGLNAAFNAKILTCEHSALDPVRRFLDNLRRASPIEQEANSTGR